MCGMRHLWCKKTIIAQPLKLEEFSEKDNPEEALKERKKTLKAVLDKVKAVLIELEEKEKEEDKDGRPGYLKKVTEEDILCKADVKSDEYYQRQYVF